MKPLQHNEIAVLLEARDGPMVSIYLPTHRAGPDTRQSPIRLKNLLREAEQQGAALEMRRATLDEVLVPARGLLEDPLFWQHQTQGLGLFLAPGFASFYRLLSACDEHVDVSDRFYLKPLLPAVAGAERFFVIALSANAVRVLEGTRTGLHEVPADSVPKSLAEALWADDPEKSLQFHTSGSTRQGTPRMPATFHGQGVPEDQHKTGLLRFFQAIDRGMKDLLRGSHAPIVLAGVDYYFPIYREANTHPHILESGVSGNPELDSADGLHQRAWPLVEPVFREREDRALAGLHDMSASGKAVYGIIDVLPAARTGRVDTLFVARDRQVWGRMTEEGFGEPGKPGQARVHEKREAGDQDLLDAALFWTLKNGGRTFVTPAARVPGKGGCAALLRY